jgi:hypothetical protein
MRIEQVVDALTAKLCAAGYPVLDGLRRTRDGYHESVVLDPRWRSHGVHCMSRM